jgi:hypothetical protein
LLKRNPSQVIVAAGDNSEKEFRAALPAVARREMQMTDGKWWLSAAALAASALPAFASTPATPSAAEPSALARVAGPTGLAAADLIVGRDGALCVDVGAPAAKLADGDSSANRHCSFNTQNGC